MSEVVELHRPSPAVEVRDLRKEFTRRDKKAGRFARRKRVALEGVTFAMERGECVAILGQNGSGKSTLVRLLSTLLFGDGGSAHVFGHDVFAEPRPVRKLVNRVSVEASFFKKMSAGENLHYAARYYGMGPRETRVKIPEILTKVGFPAEFPEPPGASLRAATSTATDLEMLWGSSLDAPSVLTDLERRLPAAGFTVVASVEVLGAPAYTGVIAFDGVASGEVVVRQDDGSTYVEATVFLGALPARALAASLNDRKARAGLRFRIGG